MCAVPAIRKLRPDVSSRIAAGEAIERPASVVKELVENALDAGATRIRIDIEEGGRSRIRVEDDGAGIASADLPLAIESFATSKISTVEDIEELETLGFRGEALASICAVSLLTIRSRSGEEEVGRERRWRAGVPERDEPFVRNRGTTVEVRDLFFNLPARRTFMSSGQAETRRISSLVQAFALASPETAFSLSDGGREILSYPASSPDERVELVFGASVFEQLRSFGKSSGRMFARGYTSLPAFTRGNRTAQHLFVNGRYVRDRMLSHAIRQAYESLVPAGRFPVTLLFLDLPGSDVDVNVHPTKAEIRFRDERSAHRLVVSAIREAVGGGDSLSERIDSVYRGIIPGEIDEFHRDAGGNGTAQNVFAFPTTPAREEGRDYGGPASLFGEGDAGDPAPHLYWQLHRSFILIQIRGGMVVIDQHAAHERILYNNAKRNISGNRPVVQSLLFPATIDLTPGEFERFEELADVLPSLGFEAESFGGRSIIVRGIPAGVRNWDEGRLLRDIFSERSSGVEGFLRTYACKAAVKAGDALAPEEMQSLADRLFATDAPYTCPHGRPTMLRVTLSDLEKRFLRTPKGD
ncbi:MAG: DNA mismatch repair endonuclease MutL [Candidatus Krumholzibacteriota bacterium]|nr:DNA mismatch repair endonuclease MutL [Candidatus Krumholzibacteriota bacterium]